MSNETEATDLFTAYYMNHSKVYEMRMLLNNTIWKERSNEKEKATSGNAEIHAKGGGRSRSFQNYPGMQTQT